MMMRILNISISDLEFEQFRLSSDQLSFTEFLRLVSREISRQNLKKTVELAERHGLSDMTMEQISEEVKAVRSNAADS